MNKIEQSTSMISEATPEVECSIHSTARCSRKARAFSFSPSTSPAMVPTRQGMTASVEQGTVPKPVPVNASGGKTIAGKPSKSVRSSTSQSTVASPQGSIGGCGCKSHRAVFMSVSCAQSQESDMTQMPGTSIVPRGLAPGVYSTLPIHRAPRYREHSTSLRALPHALHMAPAKGPNFLPRAIRAHKTRLYMAKQVLGRAPAGFFLPLRTVPSSGFAPCICGVLSGRQSRHSGTAFIGAHLAAGTGVSF